MRSFHRRSLLLVPLVVVLGGTDTCSLPSPTNRQIASGQGYTDVSPHQIVRTSSNVIYTVTPTCADYPECPNNAISEGDDIYVIDPATQEIAGTLEVGAKPQQIAFGFKGMQGPNVFVTVGGTNKVAMVPADPKNLKVLEEFAVGEGPNGIWANPEGTRIFVGHDKGNEVRIIDTGTGQNLGTVPVGRKPIRVVVSR